MTQEQTADYGHPEHIRMVSSRVRLVERFQADCPCGWRDQRASREGAELCLIAHYRDYHRWSEGQPLKCGKDVGSRPSWMSPDQYDPCRCLLGLGHDGGCACSHTLAEHAQSGRTEDR